MTINTASFANFHYTIYISEKIMVRKIGNDNAN